MHWAADAREANEIVVRLVSATGARELVKVKSLTTDEIGLNDALASAGITPLETDLAELIVQLAGERPSHLLVPALHRSRREIAELLREALDRPDLPDDPPALTAAAREYLRAAFLRARVAVSGANFAVAETGTVCVVESEGNGRMCTTLPDMLVTVMGIEKVVAEWRDLAVLLQLLPRSATGERMNPYTSLWTGVRRGDGPSAFHLVLLDAGRTRALADPEGRPALRCIRCSACVNVCPVYRQTGGHAYPTVYAGPIGAILQPQLDGERGISRVAALRLQPLRRLRGRLPRPDRHPPDPRPRACEGRPRLEAGARGTRAAPSRPRVHQRRALRAGPGGRARAPAARPPRRPPALAPRAARGLGPLPHPARGRGADLPRMVGGTWAAAVTPSSGGSGTPSQTSPRRPRSHAATAPPGTARRPRSSSSSSSGSAETGAVVMPAADPAAAVAGALAERGASRVTVAPDLDASLRPAGVEVVEDHDLPPAELDALDGAVTTCSAACAETGTIAFDGGEGQGRRAITLVPDLHVCIVRPAQIVETVPELFDSLAASAREGRPVVLVSGPSATSDIELERVEGVHGPRQLVVVLQM